MRLTRYARWAENVVLGLVAGIGAGLAIIDLGLAAVILARIARAG